MTLLTVVALLVAAYLALRTITARLWRVPSVRIPPTWRPVPGALGTTRGEGLAGFIIESGTRGAGHSLIFICRAGRTEPGWGPHGSYATPRQALDGAGFAPNGDAELWVTAEAWADGFHYRLRTVDDRVVSVLDPIQTEAGRAAVVAQAHELVGIPYAWWEIARNALYHLRIYAPPLPDGDAAICSNAAMQCLLAGAPGLRRFARFEHWAIWPEELERTALEYSEWNRRTHGSDR